MANYKCINCDQVKEGAEICTCSRCGYTMYKEPYDKNELLVKECSRFLSALSSPAVKPTDYKYYRVEFDAQSNKERTISKSMDEKRFPSFDKIKKYIFSSPKSESVREKSIISLDSLEKFITTPYEQKYDVDEGNLQQKIVNVDDVAAKVAECLRIDCKLNEIRLPRFTLHYEEKPDEEILSYANTLIAELRVLVDKIMRFVKINNAYGAFAEMQLDLIEYEHRSDMPKLELYRGQLDTIRSVINKQYIADIFSDGVEEVFEMTRVLLQSIGLILDQSPLEPICYYQFEDGDVVFGNGFTAKINSVLSERYYRFGVSAEQKLRSVCADEGDLFDLYDKFIELDSFEVFKANKTNRLKIGAYREKLDKLIGLSSVKESVNKISAYAAMNKDSENLNLHMCFYGNPGTGKTEVARIIAGILYENGILPTKNVIEVDRSGLVAQYVGQTAVKTMDAVKMAMGGVLFVDEAYALYSGGVSGDYGEEAIATLIKAMEDYRGKFCVILAGYKNSMAEMIASNPGFKSRIQFEIDFPNYSRGELSQIFDLMAEKRGYALDLDAKELALDITDVKRKEPNFANAREVRNILDQMIMCQNLRTMSENDREIGLVDAKKYIADAGISINVSGSGLNQRVMSAEEELEDLIGLHNVKRMIKKIKAYAKRNAGDVSLSLHACFYGNPGTGKTEVARILSRLLYDAGILPEAKLVETDAHGLIGKYVGETAPKTEAKIADAMGGVLFIDEAYALCETNTGNMPHAGYGDEAISMLLKKMEDNRGKFCVVFAGYQDEMKRMIDSNPGLESRIQFVVDFPDYSREELEKIALRFASKKGYTFANDAIKRFVEVVEYYRQKPNFANARTVRNVLEQVIMNQNLRAEDDSEDNEIVVQDVEDYISDEKIILRSSNEHRIGFY